MRDEHVLVTWFGVDEDLNVLVRGLVHVVADEHDHYLPVATFVPAVVERQGLLTTFVFRWGPCSLSAYTQGILMPVASPAVIGIGDSITPSWADRGLFAVKQ